MTTSDSALPVTSQPTTLPIQSHYNSLEEAISSLTELEAIFNNRQDRRAIFVTAYLTITRALKLKIDLKFFQDNEWVTRYGLGFANLYRQALLDYEQGNLDKVPKAWVIDFDTAINNSATVLQDLTLGINAHINHDLPLALKQIGIDPNRQRCYEDHTAVNQILQASTAMLKDRVCSMYAPALSLLDELTGPVDEVLTSFSIEKAREAAWTNAVALANAQNEQELASIQQNINDSSAVLARLILAPLPQDHFVLDLIRHLETITPWWMYLTLPETSEGGIDPVKQDPLIVASLDALLTLLDDIQKRYADSRKNLMSLYPAVFGLVGQKIRQTVNEGAYFEDNLWLTNLTLRFAGGYLKALESFEKGQSEQLPKAWGQALSTARDNKVTILQSLLLALNAQLNYDYAQALAQVGIDDLNIEKRQRDLEKLNQLILGELKAVQDLLARRYSRLLIFFEVILPPLRGLLIDLSYRRAQASAWENALTFCRVSQTDRQKLVAELDSRASDIARQILFEAFPGKKFIIGLVRTLESFSNKKLA